jgi:hypothetical protein
MKRESEMRARRKLIEKRPVIVTSPSSLSLFLSSLPRDLSLVSNAVFSSYFSYRKLVSFVTSVRAREASSWVSLFPWTRVRRKRRERERRGGEKRRVAG